MNKTPAPYSAQIQDFLNHISKRKKEPSSQELLELLPKSSKEDCGVILGLACNLGYLNLSKKILKVHPDLINFETDVKKFTFFGLSRTIDPGLSTPLITSLFSNNDKLSLFLIKHPGVDLDFVSSRHWDVLSAASDGFLYNNNPLTSSNIKVIEALLDKGVDPFKIKNEDFWFHSLIKQEEPDLMRLVLKEDFSWKGKDKAQIKEIGLTLFDLFDIFNQLALSNFPMESQSSRNNNFKEMFVLMYKSGFKKVFPKFKEIESYFKEEVEKIKLDKKLKKVNPKNDTTLKKLRL